MSTKIVNSQLCRRIKLIIAEFKELKSLVARLSKERDCEVGKFDFMMLNDGDYIYGSSVINKDAHPGFSVIANNKELFKSRWQKARNDLLKKGTVDVIHSYPIITEIRKYYDSEMLKLCEKHFLVSERELKILFESKQTAEYFKNIYLNLMQTKNAQEWIDDSVEFLSELLLNSVSNVENEEVLKQDPSTRVQDDIIIIKGVSYGHVGSPERGIRLAEIFKLPENKPTWNTNIFGEIKDNSIAVFITRANKSIFGGKKVIIKNASKIYWTSREL